MAPNWTPCKLKRLLELFAENYECLFYRSISHLQRKLRKETFEKIALELDMPFQALKFKYFNLNNAYNAEIKKIQAAKVKGFFYRPTLPWFKEYREIMEKVDELNKINEFSIHNLEEKRDTPPREENIESAEELEYKQEQDEHSSSETPETDTIVVSIKQEYIDGVKKGNWDVDFEETVETIQHVEAPTSTPPAESAQLSRIAYVKKPMKRPYKPDSPERSGYDEFQMFANHVAEQLRNMTIVSARKMQSEIHIIFDEEGFPFCSAVLDDI